MNPFDRDISPTLFKNCLVYVFLLGLIVRAGFMVEHARSPSFGVVTLDQKYYDTAARMILAGDDLHPLRGIRPLLYPMFLAACYKMGGDHGIDLAVAAQHLIGVLTGLLVALLGARLFQHRLSGLLGGALYLLAPVPLCFEGELLVESTYTFLILLGLLLICRSIGVTGWSGALLWLRCGALTVLAAQERPNLLMFLAVYPMLAGWQWWRTRRSVAFLPLLGLMGAAVMAVPWGFVNKMQSAHFQITPSVGGVNLFIGNNPAGDGVQVEIDHRVNYNERYEDAVTVWAREGYEAATRAQGRVPEDNPMAVSHYWTQRTMEEIEAAPSAWVRLMARKCWLMLWNTEVPNMKSFAFLQMDFFWLRVLPVRWFVLLMFAPAGIWAAAKWGNRGSLFVLLAFILLYSATNIIFFVCDRYRYPVWPAMAGIAGGGMVALAQMVRHRQWRRAIFLAAACALMAVLSLYNWFGAQLPSFARDYRLRSMAWFEKGHFTEALSDINRSLELDPKDSAALHHRGNVLLALNRFDDARQQLEQTLKITGEDSGVWNNYGIALDGVGRTNDALAAYRRAMTCPSPSQSAFFGLAFDLLRLGKLNDAAGALDQFERLEKKPNAIDLSIRSILARRRGDAAQGATLEQQARAFDPTAAAWALQRASASQ